MSRYTSMKVGGPVRYLIYPRDENDLIEVIKILKVEGIPWRMLGNGTNVIVSDKGLDEAVIKITRLKGFLISEVQKGVTVRAAAGWSLKNLIFKIVNLGLSGLEKLYSIPGTLGGAVKMNAGSFGVSISDVVLSVTYLNCDAEKEKLSRESINFSYRSSPFLSDMCILDVEMALIPRTKTEIMSQIEFVLNERKKRHPIDLPSAGSIFKAVNGVPAWRYIERSGLKGLRIGDACVSEKHANFIVNLGNATAQDIKLLIDKIKKEVYEKEGVILEEEVELWGFDG
ncbi:MAG: UDP-N-acetylmuramate dehydrogenase [Deltaproteobacteria bacterium]|nr:UDP-N-acetylmuramate dehydrogenase [Deltaproteobacteria bacterium]